jgi:TRAP-type mannitol/chloroaromatic compound transport system substrate-binding protein
MGPFECFDAASQGKIETVHAAGLFWDAKEPAAQWFTTVPLPSARGDMRRGTW